MRKYFFVLITIIVLIFASCSNSNEVFTSKKINNSSIFIKDRKITIKPFIMEDHPVTQKEFQMYCSYSFAFPSESLGKGDDYPAYYVSWYDALVYCNKRSVAENLMPCYSINDSTNPNDWGEVPKSDNKDWDNVVCNFDANGYRLPTEIEWEYCARGMNLKNKNQTKYSGSDNVEDVAWFDENSNGKAQIVKQKAANKAKLYDMSGNVWELCWDWYDIVTINTPITGELSGMYRVGRGGSYNYSASRCTVYDRNYGKPCRRYANTGFRVCRSYF